MTKRLFIFAGYDKDNIVDATLTHYLNALSKLGDIVFTMDNDAPDTELAKVQNIPNVLHAEATRHGEYDFGSYKRGYIWAQDNKILNKYDWVYLVNDSVYGPLWNIEQILDDLESRDADMTGMIYNNNDACPPHIQSWFVGLSQEIATSKFFADFLHNVKQELTKDEIGVRYEIKMSQIIFQHGYKASTFKTMYNNGQLYDMYITPKAMLREGMPFIKKSIIYKLNNPILLYPYTSDELIGSIYDNAKRIKILSDNNASIKQEYVKNFRVALFGLPILCIYRQYEPLSKTVAYKLKLFEKLPILKISYTHIQTIKETK